MMEFIAGTRHAMAQSRVPIAEADALIARHMPPEFGTLPQMQQYSCDHNHGRFSDREESECQTECGAPGRSQFGGAKSFSRSQLSLVTLPYSPDARQRQTYRVYLLIHMPNFHVKESRPMLFHNWNAS
jgi:hypothetical protein